MRKCKNESIKIYLQITFFLFFLAGCKYKNIDPYFIRIDSMPIQKSIENFIGLNTQDKKSEYVISMHILGKSCKGLEIVLISKPARMSVLMECPIDYYSIVKDKVILIYTGFSPNEVRGLKAYQDFVKNTFSNGSLTRDWDEKNLESTERGGSDGAMRGYLISGDSISVFAPKESSGYYFPCYQCF